MLAKPCTTQKPSIQNVKNQHNQQTHNRCQQAHLQNCQLRTHQQTPKTTTIKPRRPTSNPHYQTTIKIYAAYPYMQSHPTDANDLVEREEGSGIEWMGQKEEGGQWVSRNPLGCNLKKKKKIVTLSFLVIFYSNSTFRPLVPNTQIIKTTFFHRFY